MDGQWVTAMSGRSLRTVNPHDGTDVATIPACDASDIDAAVRAADQAFHRGWATTSGAERQEILLRMAEITDRRWTEIAVADALDMGMPIKRAYANGRRVVGMFRYFASQTRALSGRVIDSGLGPDMVTETLSFPLGVVGAIIPWNSPATATPQKIAPALAAGCSIVLKPSEEASLVALIFAEICEEAGVPPGVVNIVTGTGAEAGDALARHPLVRKISFTGSTVTGQKVLAAATPTLKRVTLELGGKSPIVVCNGADLERAADRIATGIFGNSGQICFAASRLYAESAVFSDVTARIAERAAALRMGDPLDPETDLGPLINSTQHERAQSILQRAVEADGAQVLSAARDALPSPNHMAPMVLTNIDEGMEIHGCEVFGPVLNCYEFSDFDSAIEAANGTDYGLGAGLFAKDLSQVHRFKSQIRAGIVWVNCYGALDASLPFGGTKMSGMGREGGADQLMDYRELKTIVLDASA
ncbi:MAG: aldehyde dehydrogenase family protein [Hyphomicrobiales bacterium]